jgi:hypothetical protein
VGLNSLKSLNLTNVYPNNNKNNNNNNNKKNNKVKSKPLELFELAGKKKFLLAVNFWPQISSKGQKDGTLFAPNFAPSMQNRNSLTPPHICT